MEELDTSDFFLKIEKQENIIIPEYLKKLLGYMGFDNHISFMKLTNDSLIKIEDFAKEDLESIVAQEEYKSEKYLYIFKNAPKKFRIVDGHKELILGLAAVLNEKAEKAKLITQQFTKKSKTVQLTATEGLVISEDINEDDKNLHLVLNGWIKTQLSKFVNINIDEANEIKSAVRRLNLNSSLDADNDLQCVISCIKCSKTVKVRKIAKIGGKSRWVLSNYYTHLNRHLEDINVNNNQIRQSSMRAYLNSTATASTSSGNVESTIINVISEDDDADLADDRFVTLSSNKKITKKRKRNRLISCEDDEEGDSELNVSPTTNPKSSQDFRECRVINEADDSDFSASAPTSVPTQQQISKWKTSKYSRAGRSKRLRSKVSHQPLITNFLTPIDEISEIIKENKKLRDMLIIHNSSSQSNDLANYSNLGIGSLLDKLKETATSNNNKKSKHGHRFNNKLKQFCTYLFIIGGRLLYESLYANLQNSIPSIATILRTLDSMPNIEEGALRFAELKTFLEERNLPNIVWLSEDGTKITGRIQYSSKNNKLVGFVMPFDENGLPIANSFLATSARKMEKHFNDDIISDYAYVIMAQSPVDKSPPFCLSVFGTDNRFNYQDVRNRWSTMTKEAAKYNIKILGWSSDGDTRLLKAMRQNSGLQEATDNWNWFLSKYAGCIYVQDTPHVGTKLKRTFLKPDITLKMGTFSVDVDHLKRLINDFSKDKHLLTLSDLSAEDKMNFRAIDKMSSYKVIALLVENIPISKGTVMFLKLTRFVLDAYLLKTLSVTDRIYHMWFAVFFLRIWRNWIINTDYTLAKNFISLNAYLCIELNAHAIINLVRLFRDKQVDGLNENNFTPWLFSSQPCEQIFRAARSLTSTFCTMVNFSINDILARLHRIESLNRTTADLADKFIFPREAHSKLGQSSGKDTTNAFPEAFPNDNEIHNTCMKALQDAKDECNAMQIKFIEEDAPWEQISVKKTVDIDECSDELDLDYLHATHIVQEEEEYEMHEINEPEIDTEEIQRLEGETLNFDFQDNIDMNSHYKENVDANSPFVQVKVKERTITMRKSSLCWLLSSQTNRVSSDRLHRFKSSVAEKAKDVRDSSSDSSKDLITQDIIIECYYACYYSDTWYIGRVLRAMAENTFEIKFLKENLNVFMWPKTDDIQVIQAEYIFFGPLHMMGVGNMTIKEDIRKLIRKKYKEMKSSKN